MIQRFSTADDNAFKATLRNISPNRTRIVQMIYFDNPRWIIYATVSCQLSYL